MHPRVRARAGVGVSVRLRVCVCPFSRTELIGFHAVFMYVSVCVYVSKRVNALRRCTIIIFIIKTQVPIHWRAAVGGVGAEHMVTTCALCMHV